MEDGVTCIAIDGLSSDEIVNKILYYSEDHRYSTLCRNVYNNFKHKVDFDKEGKALQEFMNNLI